MSISIDSFNRQPDALILPADNSESPFIKPGASDSTGREGNVHRTSLEEVLEHTLRAKKPLDTLTQQDRAALLEVARRYSGEPFAFEPIAVGLVQAMLTSFFSSWGKAPALWRPMATRVARTLFEDPVSQERLRGIWHHLCEVA